jgi:hypothetical protein
MVPTRDELVTDLTRVGAVLAPLALLLGIWAHDPFTLELGGLVGALCLVRLVGALERRGSNAARRGSTAYVVGCALVVLTAVVGERAVAVAGLGVSELGLALVLAADLLDRRTAPQA